MAKPKKRYKSLDKQARLALQRIAQEDQMRAALAEALGRIAADLRREKDERGKDHG